MPPKSNRASRRTVSKKQIQSGNSPQLPQKFQVKQNIPASLKKNRLNQILSSCRKKRILVVGDVGLDRYTIGIVERISPEAPVPVVFVQEEQLKLGLAANVADNIQALGGTPFLVGVVGRDRCAEDFRDLLRGIGVSDSHLIVDSSRRTSLKERVVSDRQQLLRIDYENTEPADSETEKKILSTIRSVIGEVDGVIVEDYAKGMMSSNLIQNVFRMAKSAKKIVAVDPNIKTPVGFYRGSSILTPNTKEAEHLAGIAISDSASLIRAGTKILKATSARHIVITRGKDGMAIFTRGNPTVHLIPTYAREVYDVSGAGDTVISVLVLGLLSGASIVEASVLGNLAAGVEVAKRGTATVSLEEIRMAHEFFTTIPV